MEIFPIKTDILYPPQDDLLAKIKDAKPDIQEGDCVVVTSKVVSIWEGRCIPEAEVESKDALAKREAELYLERKHAPHGWILHTITNNILIGSAGIDGAGTLGYYILWTEDPQDSAKRLLKELKKMFGIEKLYLIITDSQSRPLRRGVIGFALAWAGFDPLYTNPGTTDVFGEEIKGDQLINIPDALAAAAVYVMGETNEQTPLAIIRNAPYLSAQSEEEKKRTYPFAVKKEDDKYAPFLTAVPWETGQGGK